MCDGRPNYEAANTVVATQKVDLTALPGCVMGVPGTRLRIVPCQLHPVMPLVAPPHEINMHLLPVSLSPHTFATIEATMTHLGGLLDTNNSAQASPHWFTHAVTEVSQSDV
jgi:hypothetical protein